MWWKNIILEGGEVIKHPCKHYRLIVKFFKSHAAWGFELQGVFARMTAEIEKWFWVYRLVKPKSAVATKSV